MLNTKQKAKQQGTECKIKIFHVPNRRLTRYGNRRSRWFTLQYQHSDAAAIGAAAAAAPMTLHRRQRERINNNSSSNTNTNIIQHECIIVPLTSSCCVRDGSHQ